MNELSPEVIRRNRWLFAERLHWPEGAVETCEQLESEHPGFEVWWFPKQRSEVPVFDREAGFYAWRFGAQPGQMWGDTWHGRDEWFGATPEKLDAELSAFA